jgi:uncharacterized membrane protein YkoI
VTGFTKRKITVIAALVVALGAIGGGAAIAGSGSDAAEKPVVGSAGGGRGDDDATEKAISGSALDQAKATALAHTGEGTVTGTEIDDEESYYEVEVTLDNGRQVDVQLDEAFNVVGSENDGQENED